VNKEDLDGIDLTWGNLEATCALLKKIAYREGIGNILADGLKFAPERIGKGTEKYAITGKGVAITSYEPRGSMKDALELAGTAVGELHAARGAPARLIYDSLTNCAFWRRTLNRIFGNDENWGVPMLNAACGWKLEMDDWNILALRAALMERCYSIREGYVPERDDILPDRFFEETVYSKYGEPKILKKEEFLEGRKKLYRSYGLQENGIPSTELLEELGLDFTIPILEQELKI